MTNRFKSSAQIRAGTVTDAPRDTRRALDDYETPESATLALAEFVDLGPSPTILEPAAGSGRMVAALRLGYARARITALDIKDGDDFLLRSDKPWPGHVITNPPYGAFADPFIRKALTIADGKVCMLMQSGFLFGGDRALELYTRQKPELIVIIPWRVMFIDGDGVPIRSQAYQNVWIVWPERNRRDSNAVTRTEWATWKAPQPWH